MLSDGRFAALHPHLGPMPAAITVVYVKPVLATRHLGLTVGEVRFINRLFGLYA